MQPYLYPYGGYFRLIDAVDAFVVFDCVQFPRRGRVHRVEVPGADGRPTWLTLPLGYHPRDARIADLAFASGARAELDARLARLPWYRTASGPGADAVRRHLAGSLDDVVGFLVEGLRLVCALAGIATPIHRSSELGLDPALRGQERVVAVAAAHQAKVYVNAPGGTDLYDPARFAAAGMALRFLAPYDGTLRHLLPAVMTRQPDQVAADLRGGARLLPPPARPAPAGGAAGDGDAA
ncbi:MAG: WbqC family protein [Chloroflexota bacterium]